MCTKLHKALITDEFVKDLEEIKTAIEKIDLTKVDWTESAKEKALKQILPTVTKKIAKWRKRRTV